MGVVPCRATYLGPIAHWCVWFILRCGNHKRWVVVRVSRVSSGLRFVANCCCCVQLLRIEAHPENLITLSALKQLSYHTSFTVWCPAWRSSLCMASNDRLATFRVQKISMHGGATPPPNLNLPPQKPIIPMEQVSPPKEGTMVCVLAAKADCRQNEGVEDQ